MQCFDIPTFLQMNERLRSWKCPICHKDTSYKDLILDEYFEKILHSLPNSDMSEVILYPNGEWKLHGTEPTIKQEPITNGFKQLTPAGSKSKKKATPISLIDLTSDSEEETIPASPPHKRPKQSPSTKSLDTPFKLPAPPKSAFSLVIVPPRSQYKKVSSNAHATSQLTISQSGTFVAPQPSVQQQIRTSPVSHETSIVTQVNVCGVCYKPATSWCGRCRKVCYCSKQCQQQDWNTHKNQCNPVIPQILPLPVQPLQFDRPQKTARPEFRSAQAYRLRQ